MPKHEAPKQFKFKSRDGSEYVIGDLGKSTALTREKIEQSVRDQALWAESSPHIQVDAQMSAVLRARREAPDWLEGLKQVELELHGHHSKQKRKELRGLFNHYSKLLSESLATMGEFEDALAMLPKHETVLRREWKSLLEAVWKDDEHICGNKCEVAFNADANLQTRERIHAFVWSKKHGKVMPVVRAACGDLNVRPLSGALLRRHTARKQADIIIQGRSPKEAVAALRDAGLTAEKVLRP